MSSWLALRPAASMSREAKRALVAVRPRLLPTLRKLVAATPLTSIARFEPVFANEEKLVARRAARSEPVLVMTSSPPEPPSMVRP